VTFDVTDLVEYVPCRSDPAEATPAEANSDSVAAVPRSFDFSIESPVSVEQIHSAFSEKDYWLARLAAFGGIGRLDSFVVDTGSRREPTRHSADHSLAGS
jgi:hypothetical protein